MITSSQLANWVSRLVISTSVMTLGCGGDIPSDIGETTYAAKQSAAAHSADLTKRIGVKHTGVSPKATALIKGHAAKKQKGVRHRVTIDPTSTPSEIKTDLAFIPNAIQASGSTQSPEIAPTGTIGPTNQGTALTAVLDLEAFTCTGVEGGDLSITGTVQSTGSVDSVEISAAIDGGSRIAIGVIDPQDFVKDGKIKTAPYQAAVALGNGEHTVIFCFTQSGAKGREPKESCLDEMFIVVDCAPELTCKKEGFFGNLIGNPNLCQAKGHIPVHVRGDFGDNATLKITGPTGFEHQAMMKRAGESCNYHYNWVVSDHGGAGTYTFTVAGDNGSSASFQAELHCNQKKQ